MAKECSREQQQWGQRGQMNRKVQVFLPIHRRHLTACNVGFAFLTELNEARGLSIGYVSSCYDDVAHALHHSNAFVIVGCARFCSLLSRRFRSSPLSVDEDDMEGERSRLYFLRETQGLENEQESDHLAESAFLLDRYSPHTHLCCYRNCRRHYHGRGLDDDPAHKIRFPIAANTPASPSHIISVEVQSSIVTTTTAVPPSTTVGIIFVAPAQPWVIVSALVGSSDGNLVGAGAEGR